MPTAKRGSTRKKKPARKVAGRRVAKKKVTRKAAAKKRPARQVVTKKKVTRKTAAKKRPARKAVTRKKAPPKKRDDARITALEATVRSLRDELQRVREERDEVRRQLQDARAREAESDLDLEVPGEAEEPAIDSSSREPSLLDQLAEPREEGEGPFDDRELFDESHPYEAEDEYEDYDEEEGYVGAPPGPAERRRELDRERSDRELELGDEDFWFVCPKCGEHMVEHEFDNIKVERCESCGAICIDKGESELLLGADDKSMIAYRIKGLLQ